MKLLLVLVLIIFSVIVESQKYLNFQGSYLNSDCSGISNGQGFLFTNNYCIEEHGDDIWQLKISGSNNGVILQKSGVGCTGNVVSTLNISSGCVQQPEYLGEDNLGRYSIVSFSNHPNYDSNSIVMETYTNNKCTELKRAETYSNGYTFVDSNTTYICNANNQPAIIICDNGPCKTVDIGVNCDKYGNSVFCN